jgi:hypothetical protein
MFERLFNLLFMLCFYLLKVKKKLDMLSSNLHATILSNTTTAISNCVDEVLRAICNDVEVVAPQNFNPGSIQFKDLLDASSLSPAEEKDQGVCKEIVVAQDSVTSTKEMIKEMIYHYMDTSFPPLPEVIIPELSKKELLSTTEIFQEVLQKLEERGIQEESGFLTLANVDDYLAKSLVTKLDISNYDDGYQPMSILGLCYFFLRCSLLTFCSLFFQHFFDDAVVLFFNRCLQFYHAWINQRRSP